MAEAILGIDKQMTWILYERIHIMLTLWSTITHLLLVTQTSIA
jgi:hypothetical protein